MGSEAVIGGDSVDLLGSPVKTGRRGDIGRHAERYGYSVRQIKNWKADGLAAKQPAPLDHPERMADWFGAVYSKRPPGKLLEAIERLTGQKGGGGAEAAKPAEIPFEMPEIDQGELGAEASLKRFRFAEAVAHSLYEKELRAGNFPRAKAYMEQAQMASAEVRQLERALPGIKEQAGEWMRTAEVRKSTTEFLGVLFRALDSEGLRVADAFRGLESDAEISRTWRNAVRRVFAECCEGGFTEGLTLEG